MASDGSAALTPIHVNTAVLSGPTNCYQFYNCGPGPEYGANVGNGLGPVICFNGALPPMPVLDEVIPDGLGGFLAFWSGSNDGSTGTLQKQITHVTGSGSTTFTMSALLPNSFSNDMVLADSSVAFASDGRTIQAFNIADGSSVWTYSVPSGSRSTLLVSVAGGGLTAKLTNSSGVDNIIRFDSSGNPTTDSWSASQLDYYIYNNWTGLPTSGANLAMYSAAPSAPSPAVWFTPSARGKQKARTTTTTMTGFTQAGANQSIVSGWVNEILQALSISTYPGSPLCLAWLQSSPTGTNTLSTLQDFLNGTPPPPGWGHATINSTVTTTTTNSDGTTTSKSKTKPKYENGATSPPPPGAPEQPNAPSGVLTVVNDVGSFFNSTYPGGIIKPLFVTGYLPNTPTARAQILIHELGHSFVVPSVIHDPDDIPSIKYNDGLVAINCAQMIQALPGISSVSPMTGHAGVTSVTITGSNFGASPGTSTVTFNGIAATPTPANWNATSIVVTVPAGATSGNVIVTVSGVPTTGPVFTVN